MNLLLHIALFIITFFAMEFVAWATHKYIMHGIMWKLHKDHHTGSKHTLEHNDWFSLIFAIPSWLLIMLGVIYNSPSSIWIGAGMTTYGIAYFLVHDIFIHQRIKLFRNANGKYFKALRRAHKMHHKHLGKENGESFGFLIVGKKYYNSENNLAQG
ncbi:MAG: sterol desaturase family protein [Bacteroidia bacterium]|nr:sterol desaturase family protein [Bacteroidia bacterium]